MKKAALLLKQQLQKLLPLLRLLLKRTQKLLLLKKRMLLQTLLHSLRTLNWKTQKSSGLLTMISTQAETVLQRRLNSNSSKESTAVLSSGIRQHGKTATMTFPHTFSAAKELTSMLVIQVTSRRVSSAVCSSL